MQTKRNLFTIGEFSRITGMGIHSLRYYDEIGALKPEYVDPVSNYRYYSFDQLRCVPAINMCIDAGIKLSEFGSFIDNGTINYIRIISDSRDAIDRKIEEYRMQKEVLDRAEQLLNLGRNSLDGEKLTLTFGGYAVWLMPYEYDEFKESETDILVRLSSHAKRHGLQISPVCFGLTRIGIGDKCKRYAFAALNSEAGPDEVSDNIYYIESGTYLVQVCSSCSLSEAENLLKDSHTDDVSPLFSFVFLGDDRQDYTHFAAVRCS